MENPEMPTANPQVVLREEFPDCAVLFNPDTGGAIMINPTGAFVWKQLDGRHSLEDIVRKLQAESDDVPEQAAEDIRVFLESLEQLGFVGFDVKKP